MLDARTYSWPWRIVRATLVVLSGASLPLILFLLLTANDPPITPPVLARLFAELAVLPAALAWGIGWAFRATVEAGAEGLVISRRGLQREVPWQAIAGVAVWRIPLPGPGFTVRTQAGRRLLLEARDPTDLLRALAAAGIDTARAALAHPTVVYAHARQAVPPRRWYHRLGKFVVFALLPTILLFNVHQHIAYGGTLGEYYLRGLGAYLRTFAVYWSTLSIYLILYASVWRGLVEGAALATAWLGPSQAERARRITERASSVGYYAGVPLLLALRFLP